MSRVALRKINRAVLESLEGRQMFTAALAKDINANTLPSNPNSFTTVGTTTFFVATTPGTGQELWKTDGTAGGTTLVKDIRAGSAGSLPTSLVNVNGTLLFIANDGIAGAELWKSDGT